MFCSVERAYIEDGFNLYGLRACVSNYSDCLDLILDRIGPEDSDDSHLTQSACTLYGLIHARYIVTTHGLDSMYNKVSLTLFFSADFLWKIYNCFIVFSLTPTDVLTHFFVCILSSLICLLGIIADNQQFICTVCFKRVWCMSTYPMQRSAGITRRFT